jgi:predicted RNA-binding Zn ribbon-like protein
VAPRAARWRRSTSFGRAPGCVLLYVSDHPRRQWCSNACGNRARQARHYRRTHARD